MKTNKGGLWSAAEFDAMGPMLANFSEVNLKAAREILVEGRPQVNAANDAGITPQRVGQVVKEIIALRDRIPVGWQRVEVWVPPELVETVHRIEADARQVGGAPQRRAEAAIAAAGLSAVAQDIENLTLSRRPPRRRIVLRRPAG